MKCSTIFTAVTVLACLLTACQQTPQIADVNNCQCTVKGRDFICHKANYKKTGRNKLSTLKYSHFVMETVDRPNEMDF